MKMWFLPKHRGMQGTHPQTPGLWTPCNICKTLGASKSPFFLWKEKQIVIVGWKAARAATSRRLRRLCVLRVCCAARSAIWFSAQFSSGREGGREFPLTKTTEGQQSITDQTLRRRTCRFTNSTASLARSTSYEERKTSKSSWLERGIRSSATVIPWPRSEVTISVSDFFCGFDCCCGCCCCSRLCFVFGALSLTHYLPTGPPTTI